MISMCATAASTADAPWFFQPDDPQKWTQKEECYLCSITTVPDKNLMRAKGDLVKDRPPAGQPTSTRSPYRVAVCKLNQA